MIAGAGWGAIPGLLKARYGAHEVINTIMMNFIAFALMNYLVTSVYQEPGQMIPQTRQIHEAAQLPRLASLLPILPRSNPLNVSFLLACGCAACCYVFLTHTRWGYELRLVGNARDAAAYGGINPGTVTIWVMALSGSVAGLAGVAEVMGYRYRFLDNFSSGWGFTGIAVALLGRNNPFGILAAAILFGSLNKVALDIEILLEVPRGLFLAGQGMLIIWLVSIESISQKFFNYSQGVKRGD
jgi:simple sugar transport system permease protein